MFQVDEVLFHIPRDSCASKVILFCLRRRTTQALWRICSRLFRLGSLAFLISKSFLFLLKQQ